MNMLRLFGLLTLSPRVSTTLSTDEVCIDLSDVYQMF